MLVPEVPLSDEGDEVRERSSEEVELLSSDSELGDDEDDGEGVLVRVGAFPRRLVVCLRVPWRLGGVGLGEGGCSSSELLSGDWSRRGRRSSCERCRGDRERSGFLRRLRETTTLVVVWRPLRDVVDLGLSSRPRCPIKRLARVSLVPVETKFLCCNSRRSTSVERRRMLVGVAVLTSAVEGAGLRRPRR